MLLKYEINGKCKLKDESCQIFKMQKVKQTQAPNYKLLRKKRTSKVPLNEMTKDEARRFCLETGMHGFQYIAKKDNSPHERFIWTFISFGALITALILSTLSFAHITNPTFIVTDSMQDRITNFLFPAVSICSLNKISKQALIQLMNKSLHMNPEDKEALFKLKILTQLYFAYDEAGTDYNEYRKVFLQNKITGEDAITRVAVDCADMIVSCMWKRRKIRCNRLFQTTRTPEGICCTYNHFAFKNRTFSGYMADRYRPFPRKVASCGHTSGLKVLLKTKTGDNWANEISAYGFKVLIHDPYDYPDWSAQRILIPLGQQIYVDVSPKQTYASDEIRALSIEKRQCVFQDERKLQIFANYTYLNCMTECRIKIVINICGCMPFYFRNEWYAWKPKIRVCQLKDIPCVAANKQRFMSAAPGYDTYQTKNVNHKWGTEYSECQCMQDCEQREFTVGSTAGKLSKNQLASNRKFFGNIDNLDSCSVLSVFFKELTGVRNRRDVVLTWFSIFGLFGGLLGLCLGFSFIAVVDVIYTFSLRLSINICRWKTKASKVKQLPDNTTGFKVLPAVNEPIKASSNPDQLKYNKHSIGNDIWFIN